MDLYLHIGTEKTGTTSIQDFLSRHSEALNNAGAQVLKLPGKQYNLALAALAMTEPRGSQVKRIFGLSARHDIVEFRNNMGMFLSAELAGSKSPFAILSNEHCSSRLRHEKELQALRDFLAPHFQKISVVIYLRRQDEFLLSTYSTAVRVRSTEPLQIPEKHSRLDRYDYWALLSRWQRVFGRENILCRKFEKFSLNNGNVVDDFCAAIGVRAGPDFDPGGRKNRSLDAKSLEFLRKVNLQMGSAFDGWPRLIQILERMSDGPLLTLPEPELTRFMGVLRESNGMVAREYFGGPHNDSDDPLFSRRSEAPARIVADAITATETEEFALKVWAAFNGHQ